MAARERSLGPLLDLWLERLDAEGFRIGMRERLVIQNFLARLAVAGDLPANPASALELIAPLVCTSPPSQRHYATILKDFLALAPGAPQPSTGIFRKSSQTEEQKPGRVTLLLMLGFALTLIIAAGWSMITGGPWLATQYNNFVAEQPPLTRRGEIAEPVPPMPVGKSPPPIYVPVRPFAEQDLAPLATAASSAPAIGAWIVAGLGGLALAFAAWSSRRRQLYLRRTRTNEAVHEHVLTDARGQALQTPAAPLRAATRGLRQRIAGERQILDLGASQTATIRAGGAFSPRWRLLHHTPEYLALVDSRHPADHLTTYVEALLHTLAEQGVALQIFYYEASLEFGCWRLRPGRQGNERFDRASLAELAARYGGQRLLVFGDCNALVHSLNGQAAAWTRQLTAFPQRAWFSPLPIASWGNPERAADNLGFLVLPAQPESMVTLAGWFSAGDLSLAPADDWPFAYPELLKDDALAWVVRQTPPPATVLEELRYQLRAYLGPQRYQWLCACAIYPALAPALTLVLGRELSSDARQLALGFAAFGALPWFRHDSMPDWLRQSLLEELTPDNEARFQKAVETCLEQALEGGSGPELMHLAERRVAAWLHRGSGPARDLVMVEFLSRGRLNRLARRLPEALRRRLFRHGSPAFGLRPASLVALAAVSLLAFALPWLPPLATPVPEAASGQPLAEMKGHSSEVWQAAFSPDGQRIATAGDDRTIRRWDAASGSASGQPLAGHGGAVSGVAFSPDGRRIASASADNTLRQWDAASGAPIGQPLAGHGGAVTSVAFSPNGRRLASASADNTLRVWDAASGAPIGQPLAGHGGAVTSVGFSPDGRRLVSGSRDNTLRVWDAASGAPVGQPLAGHGGAVTSVAFSPDGQRLVSGSDDQTLRLWDAASGAPVGQPLAGHGGAVTSVAFSPDGRVLASGGGDNTLRRWDAASGAPIGRPVRVHASGVSSVAFSPDGQRLLTASADGSARLWGTPAPPRLDLIACPGAAVDSATRALADRLAAPQSPPPRKASYPQGLAVTAYTPAAWTARHGQTPPAAGEIRIAAGNAEQKALAGALLDWLLPKPNATDQELRIVEDSASPPPAVAANLCANQPASPQLVPQAPPLPPATASLLANYKVVIFVCAVAGNPASQLAKSLVPALQRFGARPTVSSIDEKGRATLAPSDRGLQIRVTQQYPDEQRAAKLLLGEPEFKASGAWRIVTTRQDSQNYLSLLVCPVDYAAGDQAPTGGPANALPPAKSSQPRSPPNSSRDGASPKQALPDSPSTNPVGTPTQSVSPPESAPDPKTNLRQQNLPNQNLNSADPRQQSVPSKSIPAGSRAD